MEALILFWDDRGVWDPKELKKNKTTGNIGTILNNSKQEEMSRSNERINTDGLFNDSSSQVGMDSVGEETPLLTVRSRGKNMSCFGLFKNVQYISKCQILVSILYLT